MSMLLDLLELVLQIVDALTTQIIAVAIVGTVLLLLAAVIAPFDVLRWYAGWGRSHPKAKPEATQSAPQATAEAEHYLIYLSGIGDVSGESPDDEEIQLLDRLAKVLPGTTIIHDIFSFSVDNTGLTQEQWLGRFWQWCHQRKSSKGRIAVFGQLINLRNLLQVAVSADRRYGPIYNYGTAGTIARTLLLHGYRVGSGKAITLLGYSGGGQIALGSAKYLHATLQAPVQIISLGGVMSNDRSLDSITRLDHLYGAYDYIQRVGAIIFPARWPVAQRSRWNKALAAGIIRFVALGPIAHNGSHGYLSAVATLPDGTRHLDHTVAMVQQMLAGLRQSTSH